MIICLLTKTKSGVTLLSDRNLFKIMITHRSYSQCEVYNLILESRGAGTGAGGAVLPLAFRWYSNEVKRLLCCIAKVSVVSDSLPFSAVIPALVGLDSSF